MARSAAEAAARRRQSNTAKAIVRMDLAGPTDAAVRQVGSQPLWFAGTLGEQRVYLPSYPAGDCQASTWGWYVRAEFRYQAIASRNDAELIYSSTSLNFHPDGDNRGSSCLLRYDYDANRHETRDAYHLNVLQPHGLDDRLHLPVSPESDAEGAWDLDWVLKHFLGGEFRSTIAERWT